MLSRLQVGRCCCGEPVELQLQIILSTETARPGPFPTVVELDPMEPQNFVPVTFATLSSTDYSSGLGQPNDYKKWGALLGIPHIQGMSYLSFALKMHVSTTVPAFEEEFQNYNIWVYDEPYTPVFLSLPTLHRDRLLGPITWQQDNVSWDLFSEHGQVTTIDLASIVNEVTTHPAWVNDESYLFVILEVVFPVTPQPFPDTRLRHIYRDTGSSHAFDIKVIAT